MQREAFRWYLDVHAEQHSVMRCFQRLQVKYVVELARAIATHPAVHRVDLLTRLVKDPKVGHAVRSRSNPV